MNVDYYEEAWFSYIKQKFAETPTISPFQFKTIGLLEQVAVQDLIKNAADKILNTTHTRFICDEYDRFKVFVDRKPTDSERNIILKFIEDYGLDSNAVVFSYPMRISDLREILDGFLLRNGNMELYLAIHDNHGDYVENLPIPFILDGSVLFG
jgi:hypothetical protein